MLSNGFDPFFERELAQFAELSYREWNENGGHSGFDEIADVEWGHNEIPFRTLGVSGHEGF